MTMAMEYPIVRTPFPMTPMKIPTPTVTGLEITPTSTMTGMVFLMSMIYFLSIQTKQPTATQMESATTLTLMTMAMG